MKKEVFWIEDRARKTLGFSKPAWKLYRALMALRPDGLKTYRWKTLREIIGYSPRSEALLKQAVDELRTFGVLTRIKRRGKFAEYRFKPGVRKIHWDHVNLDYLRNRLDEAGRDRVKKLYPPNRAIGEAGLYAVDFDPKTNTIPESVRWKIFEAARQLQLALFGAWVDGERAPMIVVDSYGRWPENIALDVLEGQVDVAPPRIVRGRRKMGVSDDDGSGLEDILRGKARGPAKGDNPAKDGIEPV